MCSSIIDAEKLQNEQFINKEFIMVCSKCGAKLIFTTTQKEFDKRFHFGKCTGCGFCASGIMRCEK